MDRGGVDVSFRLTTSAFAEGGEIPKEFTCEGRDVSPPLEWSNAPGGTRSFALIVDDPDAPRGTFTHWLLYDVPADAARIDEHSASVGRTLPNDFGKPGYGGPCPPRGHGPHRYRFTLYALDVPSLQVQGESQQDLEGALSGHTLATTRLTGRYERA
jgi:Raf kinase inhibitor-like YbhB/YbcL family protein